MFAIDSKRGSYLRQTGLNPNILFLVNSFLQSHILGKPRSKTTAFKMLPSIDPADFNFMPFDTSLIGPGTSFDFRGGLADACWQDLHFNAILPSSATALQQTMPPIQSYHFTQTDPISPLNTSVQPYNFAFAHDSDSAASMSLEDFDQRLESFDPHQVHDMTDASRYSESSSGVSIPYVNPISTAFISNQPRNLLSAAVFGNENGLEYFVPPAVSTYHFGAGQQPTLPADDGMDLYMKQISETACLHAQIDLFLNSDITLANDGMLKADRWETLTSSSVQSHRVPGATFNHSLEPSWIASHQQSQIGKESSIQQQGTLRDSNPRRKRKIDRKNGKACGLCKEQKGKASLLLHSFYALTDSYSAMPSHQTNHAANASTMRSWTQVLDNEFALVIMKRRRRLAA